MGISLLFLRSEELLNIRMTPQFISDSTMVPDIYGMRALVLTIEGIYDPFPPPFISLGGRTIPIVMPS
jgi:hypothetical protein